MLGGWDDRFLSRAANKVSPWVALVGVALLFAACVRQGPPAPVDDRTGAYTGRAVRPSPPPHPSEHAAAAPRRAPVRAAPLQAPGSSHAPQSAHAGYIEVEVNSGETLYAISRTYSVPIRPLIDLNQLQPPYGLKAGQKLKVPTLPVHRVVEGDTLTGIARTYGVSVQDIAETNRLERPYRVNVGSRLLIPIANIEPVQTAGGSIPSTDVASPTLSLPQGAPPKEPPTADSPGRDAAAFVENAPAVAATEPVSLPVAPTPHKPIAPLPTSRGFLWPVRGTIASGFGSKPGGLQNDGVNIVARRGTPVRAAEDGVVVYAGNELRGYGNLLLVRHAEGWMSAYAHNDELLVGRGARVKRGQIIAKVGGTGGVSSTQLHFELRQGGRPVDPMQVMGPM